MGIPYVQWNWFKAKVLRILKDEFECVPTRVQRAVLGDIVREALRTKASEFEAAIFFMLAQLNALIPDAMNAQVAAFVER